MSSQNEWSIAALHRNGVRKSWQGAAAPRPVLAQRVSAFSFRPAEELYDLQSEPGESRIWRLRPTCSTSGHGNEATRRAAPRLLVGPASRVGGGTHCRLGFGALPGAGCESGKLTALRSFYACDPW